MGFDAISTFMLASVLLSIAPGPDNIFVLTQSLLYGAKAGILITLGLCTGLLVHTSIVAAGIAAIFMVNELAFTALKFAGALYLLWLAWQAWHASSTELPQSGTQVLGAMQLYRRGIFMNLTNPKVAIFFLAFLPQFTAPEAGSLTIQLLFLGLLFIIVALVTFSFIAVIAGQIAHLLQRSEKIQKVMNRVAAIVFCGLAARLALVVR